MSKAYVRALAVLGEVKRSRVASLDLVLYVPSSIGFIHTL